MKKKKELKAELDFWKGHYERVSSVCNQLRLKNNELKVERDNFEGAMDAQDERERLAGDRCGVPYEYASCDWPEAVADRVLELQAERDALKAERDALQARIDGGKVVHRVGNGAWHELPLDNYTHTALLIDVQQGTRADRRPE